MKSAGLLSSASLLVLLGSVACAVEDVKSTSKKEPTIDVSVAAATPDSPDARFLFGGLGLGGFGLGGFGLGGFGLGGLGFGGLGGFGLGGLGFGGLGLGGLGFGGLGFGGLGGLGFGGLLWDEDADSDSSDRVPAIGSDKTAMNDEDMSGFALMGGMDGAHHRRHGGMRHMGWGNKHQGWGNKHQGWGNKHHGWGDKSGGMKHHASWDSRRRFGMENNRRGQEEMVDVVLKPLRTTEKNVKQDGEKVDTV